MTTATPTPLPIQGEPQPIGLPDVSLSFFGLALLWLLLGALGLAAVADQLVAGNPFAPRIFAATHAFTIGVVTHAIFGALHQFLPAVAGVPIRHPRVARAGVLFFLVGTPMLVGSLWWWHPGWQAAAWLVLFLAVGAASWNVLPARRRATRNRYVTVFVSLAHSALGVAMILAAARIGQGLGWWQVDRVLMLAAHFHLGAVGFGALTAFAFTSKMIPAFLGSRMGPDRRIDLCGWLATAGLTMYTVGALVRSSILLSVGGGLLAAAALIHLTILFDYYRKRGGVAFDASLGFITLAALMLLAALITGVTLLVRGGGPAARLWTLYPFLIVVGWLALLIIGVLHRVAPRIVVLRMAGAGRSLSPSAQRLELLSVRLSWASLILVGTGVIGTALGLGLGAALVVRGGAILLAAGAAALLAQAAHLMRAAVRQR